MTQTRNLNDRKPQNNPAAGAQRIPRKPASGTGAYRATHPDKAAAKALRQRARNAELDGTEVPAEALRAVEQALEPHWLQSCGLRDWSREERRSLSEKTGLTVYQLYKAERLLHAPRRAGRPRLTSANMTALGSWREEHGLTIDDLSAMTGVGHAYLYKIELGQRRPSAQTREEIEQGPGVLPGVIFPAPKPPAVPDEADPEFFNEFLARARVESGLSWIELAAAAGVGMKTAGDWLMGRRLPRQGGSRTPPREKLGRIAAAVGYPLSYVIECWERTLEGAYPQRQNLTCIRGHLFDETNTYWTPDGDRQCRACRRLRGPGWPSRQQPRPYRPSPRTPPRNESGYRGVRRTKAGCWAAGIMHGYQTHYLGIFTTPEQAARAYDARATELKGERARLNFPVTA